VRTLIVCLFTINPPNTPYFSQSKQREQEFVEGFRSFRKVYDNHLSEDYEVLLVENTVKDESEIPASIREEWSGDWHFISTGLNEYGGRNKGTGILENYKALLKSGALADYDWIIHFEPRLVLQSDVFFKEFEKFPIALFAAPSSTQFFTGLFAIEPWRLEDFISLLDFEDMVNGRLSLEDLLFKYMSYSSEGYGLVEKVDCLWHDSYAGTSRVW
jgi:hypothetical protein